MEDNEEDVLSEFECKLKLRSYGQPITLFGEKNKDRHTRLKTFELDFILRHGGSMGKRNGTISHELTGQRFRIKFIAQSNKNGGLNPHV